MRVYTRGRPRKNCEHGKENLTPKIPNQARLNPHFSGFISNIRMFEEENNKLPHYSSIRVKG